MIRISRGPEPEEMRLIRRRFLAGAMIAKQDNMPVNFDGYAEVKEDLAKRLNYKCVFCEFDLRIEGSPVEHFRPKAWVQNKGEPQDVSRYWWLAWTWQNLLFACDRCNTHQKKKQFPLEPGTTPLPVHGFNLDSERPLLIDPDEDDPREHIRFKWSDSRKRWLPFAFSRSMRGSKTIEILGLDEDDRAMRHVEERVQPWIEQIRVPSSVASLNATWQRAMGSLFAPGQPFHSLTWDVVDREFPESFRKKHHLAAPTIGNHRRQANSPPFDFASSDDSSEFSHLSERLKLEVRALQNPAKEEVAIPLLEKVLAVRPWTNKELASLFGRTESTIKAWKRKIP